MQTAQIIDLVETMRRRAKDVTSNPLPWSFDGAVIRDADGEVVHTDILTPLTAGWVLKLVNPLAARSDMTAPQL